MSFREVNGANVKGGPVIGYHYTNKGSHTFLSLVSLSVCIAYAESLGLWPHQPLLRSPSTTPRPHVCFSGCCCTENTGCFKGLGRLLVQKGTLEFILIRDLGTCKRDSSILTLHTLSSSYTALLFIFPAIPFLKQQVAYGWLLRFKSSCTDAGDRGNNIVHHLCMPRRGICTPALHSRIHPKLYGKTSDSVVNPQI